MSGAVKKLEARVVEGAIALAAELGLAMLEVRVTGGRVEVRAAAADGRAAACADIQPPASGDGEPWDAGKVVREAAKRCLGKGKA